MTTSGKVDLATFEPWVDKAAAATTSSLAATRAPALRLFHIGLVLSLEEKKLSFPATASGGPPLGYGTRHIITRICNEVGGVAGCLYWGSPLAALHHVRALMELAACAQHLHPSNKASSLTRRWKRLQEFEDAARGAQYEKDAAAEGVVAYVDPTSRFSASDVAFFSSKKAEWVKLYDLKKTKSLSDIPHWHQPASIKDLFNALPAEHWSMYGHICNCCHFSPLGERLGKAPKGGYPLFVTDKEPVNQAVDLAVVYITMAAATLDAITPLPRLKDLVEALPL